MTAISFFFPLDDGLCAGLRRPHEKKKKETKKPTTGNHQQDHAEGFSKKKKEGKACDTYTPSQGRKKKRSCAKKGLRDRQHDQWTARE